MQRPGSSRGTDWIARAVAGASLVAWLALPGISAADHVDISGVVSAEMEKIEPTRVTALITWSFACEGASPGNESFQGTLYLVENGERTFFGGASGSGQTSASFSRTDADRYASALIRMSCFEHGGLEEGTHGSDAKEFASAEVLIPAKAPETGGGGGGGGGGSGGGGGGRGGGGGGCERDPPAPAKSVCLSGKGNVKKGKVVKLTAIVYPCAGHEEDTVDLYRGNAKIRTVASDAACKAVFKVKMNKTATFRGVSPELDADHVEGRSRRLKVKVS